MVFSYNFELSLGKLLGPPPLDSEYICLLIDRIIFLFDLFPNCLQNYIAFCNAFWLFNWLQINKEYLNWSHNCCVITVSFIFLYKKYILQVLQNITNGSFVYSLVEFSSITSFGCSASSLFLPECSTKMSFSFLHSVFLLSTLADVRFSSGTSFGCSASSSFLP